MRPVSFCFLAEGRFQDRIRMAPTQSCATLTPGSWRNPFGYRLEITGDKSERSIGSHIKSLETDPHSRILTDLVLCGLVPPWLIFLLGGAGRSAQSLYAKESLAFLAGCKSRSGKG